MIEGIRRLKVHLAEEAISRYQHRELDIDQFANFVSTFTQHKDWSQEFISQSYNLYFIVRKARLEKDKPVLWAPFPLAGFTSRLIK